MSAEQRKIRVYSCVVARGSRGAARQESLRRICDGRIAGAILPCNPAKCTAGFTGLDR